jgi:hypothetical protein
MAEYNYLKAVQSLPAHRGQRELINHLEGKELSRSQAMIAMCYGCMGGYTDGAKDCLIAGCPLYGFMPYAEKKSGPKRTLSPEHLEKLQAARRK